MNQSEFKAKVEAILTKYPDLHMYGVGKVGDITDEEIITFRAHLLSKDSLELIDKLCDWLYKAKLVEIVKSPKPTSSYQLKHIAEDMIKTYVANGQLIVAMLLNRWRPNKSEGYNTWFNIHRVSLNNIIKERDILKKWR